MTGADVNFGGKGTFHASHGFVERLGFNALKARAGTAAQQTWGREPGEWKIEDEALFALVRAKLDELANQAEPFALVLTTIDTHGPSGFSIRQLRRTPRHDRCGALRRSPRCRVHRGRATPIRISSWRCSRVTSWATLALTTRSPDTSCPTPKKRRLRFVAWGPDIRTGVVDRPGTHFDVMPTLMDFLGLSAWTEHYLGASLLRFDSPWFGHDSPLSLRVVHELLTSRLRRQLPLPLYCCRTWIKG